MIKKYEDKISKGSNKVKEGTVNRNKLNFYFLHLQSNYKNLIKT